MTKEREKNERKVLTLVKHLTVNQCYLVFKIHGFHDLHTLEREMELSSFAEIFKREA